MRSTAFPRFSIDRFVSRRRRLASVEVQRSSHKWTGSLNFACSSSANCRIFSDCVPSAPDNRNGNPTTISATSYFASTAPRALPVATFILALNGIETLGGDAEGIGDGDPNSPRAYIERQHAGGRGHRRIMAGRPENVKEAKSKLEVKLKE